MRHVAQGGAGLLLGAGLIKHDGETQAASLMFWAAVLIVTGIQTAVDHHDRQVQPPSKEPDDDQFCPS